MLIMYDIKNMQFKYTLYYLRSLWWKMKSLCKMTVGYWDDDMIKRFQIKEKAKVYDDDLTDGEKYHFDMLCLIGESHSLFWQFHYFTVVLAKLAEAVNRSPLMVYTSDNRFQMPSLYPAFLSAETSDLPPLLRKLANLYLALKGRICIFITELICFVVEVFLAVDPSVNVILVFWVLILPERAAQTVMRWKEMEVKTPYLSKVMYYLAHVISEWFEME